jgi:hypothetical protein
MHEKYNIICLSNQLWDYPNWTNKRHVMMRLSKMGHKVIFVDPPIFFGKVLLTQFKKGFFNLKRLITGTKKDENAIIFTPVKFFNNEKFFSKFFASKINKLMKDNSILEAPTILWIYNVEIPCLDTYLENINRDFLIYDCVDYYAGFPRYQSKDEKEKIIETEKKLCRNSDLVFATAPGLVERLKKINSKTFYTPNVGDFDLFYNIKERFKELPKELKDIPKPIIGYIGALDSYKFNYKLVKDAAVFYPNYSFVLIGNIGLKDREGSLAELGLENLPNVYFLGEIPFIETPRYMAHFDVDLIPYVYNDYTIGGCFPVKFFNSMSAGIPCVVTDLPVFTMYKNVTYISKTNEDFVLNIQKAMEENKPKRQHELISVSRLNTYEIKVANMLSLIKQHLKERND